MAAAGQAASRSNSVPQPATITAQGKPNKASASNQSNIITTMMITPKKHPRNNVRSNEGEEDDERDGA